MLVIARKERESLIIEAQGEVIEITVMEHNNQVRLGIDAPQGCKIWRKELYETIVQNRQAMQKPSTGQLQDLLKQLGAD